MTIDLANRILVVNEKQGARNSPDHDKLRYELIGKTKEEEGQEAQGNAHHHDTTRDRTFSHEADEKGYGRGRRSA